MCLRVASGKPLKVPPDISAEIVVGEDAMGRYEFKVSSRRGARVAAARVETVRSVEVE